MTVNVVYAGTNDGHLTSSDASYANARNGPADLATNTGNIGYYGQNNNGGVYLTLQGAMSFTYAAVAATEVVTAAFIQTWSLIQNSAGVSRDMEFRAVAWSIGGIELIDWKTPSQLSAATLHGVVSGVQSSASKYTRAGTDELRDYVAGNTTVDEFVVSSRQRNGNTPTSDEGSAFATSDEAGTTYDPALIFTTVSRSMLTSVLGAAVQMAGGGHAAIISTGTSDPNFTLKHWDPNGNTWSVALPSGPALATDFSNTTRGAQIMTLVRDELDNLYVIGKAANAANSLAVRAYVKSPGVWTWTAGTFRTVSLPSYSTSINNVAATYHSTAGGTLVVLAGHTAGPGVSGGNGNELSYALLDATYLRTGTGTLSRATGSALGTLQPALAPADFNGFANESGTGLDVVADAVQADWGYVLSFKKDQNLGQNRDLYLGRYILNASGNGFTHTSTQSGAGFAAKDAAAKVRLVPVGDGQVASVTADADVGWGLTVKVWQAQGSTPGLVQLGGATLAGESANMPDGPAVSVANWWDAVYSSAENSLWLYYRHASNAIKVMRTRFSLDTYQPTGQEIEAYSGLTVQGVRASRNASATISTRLLVATVNGGTLGSWDVLDSFNLAPTAPILTLRANFDATAAATFAWTFTDPNVGDTQSAYDLEIQRVDTSAVVVTTGKVSSVTPSRNVTGGTLTNALEYRWRVRTWDAADVDGPWSDWGTFSTSAGGTVTITDPATDNELGMVTDETQVSWSVAGTTQASYRVILVREDTGATVSDTGWVTSTDTAVLVSGMVPGVEHTVSVQVRNGAAVVSGIGTRKITPNYGTPETPLITVTSVPDEGYVLVAVDNPISGQPDLGTTVWDMEAGIAEWSASGCTMTHSSAQAHSGTKSLLMTITGSPTQAYVRAYGNKATVEPTERYTARMWIYCPVADTITAAIDWAAVPGGAYVGTSATDWAVPANTWTEIQITGTCPAGAGEASYGPTVPGSPANGTLIYVDDVIIVAASDRPPVDSNLILRRPVGSTAAWDQVGEVGEDGSFRDYTAPGGVPLAYMVRGVSE